MSLAQRLAQSERPDKHTEMMVRVQARLIEVLGPKLYDSSLSDEHLESLVLGRVQELLEEESSTLTLTERNMLMRTIADGVLGLGPLEDLMRDPSVSEILVNGHDTIFVEREGKLHRTDAHFLNEEQLRHVIDKTVARVGRRIDESSPYVDARLDDGSRVNAIIPPLAIDGPVLTIRKFSAEPYVWDDLITFGTMTPEVKTLLEACVRGRLNILVSGGTGSGKTTSLNVLSSFIPTDERIITIEDAAELRLQQPHVVRLEYRPPNIEGAGEISIRHLVRNSLRMRPDRIVVGEVRGKEALDMLQAMNTGHDGSISTIHANSPRDALARLETMSSMAGMDLGIRAIREQMSSAIDLVIHQSRLKDGSRRFTHVTEIVGMEGEVITLQDLFVFDHSAGMDKNGRHLGALKPTGLRPAFLDNLEEHGITIPPETFAAAGEKW